MLCYVRDDEDGVLRACALRTLVRYYFLYHMLVLPFIRTVNPLPPSSLLTCS
jgi:hypothetical protein